MDKIYLSVAGFKIRINFQKSRYKTVAHGFARDRLMGELLVYLKDFVVNRRLTQVDFTIGFQERHYPDRYRHKRQEYTLFYEWKQKREITTFYQISLSQFQIILLDVINSLILKNDGLFLHASASNIQGYANVFMGSAGSGKSTAITLLNKRFTGLTDEGALIRKVKKDYFLYQTPIVEKGWWIKRSSKPYRLGKIFFLKKAPFFKMEKIEDKELIFKKIAKQLLIADNKTIKKLLSFVSEFNHFFFLFFAKDEKRMIEFFLKENFNKE